ncbi:MAG: succinate dehydrogenase assembly factor 2 [Pasteurellaceae bacterium]|nr:succinate dehydrogenase assembly factor 2 [Pasteurellaceae bacterium]
MDQYNRLRLEWDCRRGMLELDNVIMPFYLQYFDQLDEQKQAAFVRLLACSDLQLFSWFFNRVPTQDEELQHIVQLIQSKLNLDK